LLLLKEICKAGGISSLDIKPKKLLGHISKVKSLDIDIKNIISIDKAKELGIFEHRELTIVKFVYERYESKKIHDNLLDYDDLLVLTRKILIESKEIREK
jgi:superfamily I DNA/RNA helicase